MGAHISLTLPAPNGSLELARTLRCDDCREELGLAAQRYWRMQFCCLACMTAYQQRLGPETKVKIARCLRDQT